MAVNKLENVRPSSSWRQAARMGAHRGKLPPLKPELPEAARPNRLRRASVPNLTREPATRTRKRPRTTPMPLRSWRASLEDKIQIPRKQWRFFKELFDDHADEDSFITEQGFVTAVMKADEKKAEDHGKAVEARFMNKDLGSSMGEKAERNYLQSDVHCRKKWAQNMFQSVVSKKANDLRATWRGRDKREAERISLLDFMCMNFRHLPRSAVRRACEHYQKPPPPAPTKERLSDVEGAQEEIKEMFEGLDTDGDGLVRCNSLAMRTSALGISQDDLAAWMTELPPALQRTKALPHHTALVKTKSKLTLSDFERLMAPVYIKAQKPALTLSEELESIKTSIEFHCDMAMDAMYSY